MGIRKHKLTENQLVGWFNSKSNTRRPFRKLVFTCKNANIENIKRSLEKTIAAVEILRARIILDKKKFATLWI